MKRHSRNQVTGASSAQLRFDSVLWADTMLESANLSGKEVLASRAAKTLAGTGTCTAPPIGASRRNQ